MLRKKRSGRHNGREERRVTLHVKEGEDRDDGRVRLKQQSFKLSATFLVWMSFGGLRQTLRGFGLREEEGSSEKLKLL